MASSSSSFFSSSSDDDDDEPISDKGMYWRVLGLQEWIVNNTYVGITHGLEIRKN